ncbi:MAG: UDP-3-O-(3-hydroxymyristoyl)glucosamine N-acyltransferase [Pyrinomonadaceae bacterium]
MKLIELATATGARIESGNPQTEISGAAGLDEARSGEISFLANPRYALRVKHTHAAAIFLSDSAASDSAAIDAGDKEIAILRSSDPYLAYTRALRIFHPRTEVEHFIHPSAFIEPTAGIAEGVRVEAFVYVGQNCFIGEGTHLHSNASIYENASIGEACVIHSNVSIRAYSRIGNRVIIHNNSVIGSDGFGYARDEEKHWLKIPQTGSVVIEDDVEIGAGTAIDRASVGETRIGRGTKIDNLVQIGHSCTVGEDTLLCGQVGLAGTSRIGNRVILAGQVGIAGHLKVGDDSVVTAKSATSHDVAPGKMVSGIPAFDNKEWLRSTAAFRRLSEMQKRLRELEIQIEALTRQLESQGRES